MSSNNYEQLVLKWLQEVVIGLNLCPFARQPYENGRVRIVVDDSKAEDAALDRIIEEILLLDRMRASEIETTLIAIPGCCDEFKDYLALLDQVEQVIERGNWSGIYQVASFHPRYQFEGEPANAISNFTNRAPCPIFHLIRESNMTEVLRNFKNPEQIPVTNIKRLESLTEEDLRNYFNWCFTKE